MTRKECLDAAAQCVLQDRASQYGGMEDNFGRIALLWSDYLGVKLDAVDVAMCMALLKVARIRNNKGHADSFVDLAGYAACGAECVSGQATPKAEGCEELADPFRDVPQTPEAVCRHIVESSPAVFGRPRTPTGEELAELEEDAHG
jgi:hypothetical protein